MRTKILQKALDNQAFMVQPNVMSDAIALLSTLTDKEAESAVTVGDVANNSVVYETVGNVAVISLDGAMYKKNMTGLCMNVVSYDQILKKIDMAESDNSIDTILFRVDTPGGAVAGADEVGERIYNSPKKTVTLYENLGASGGIYIFSAADELYATRTTQLGSIGVIVTFSKRDAAGDEHLYLTSKNAENKVCDMEGDCLDRIQTRIDEHERMFYDRVMRNTGFSAEQIRDVFDKGDIIFAEKAYEEGFINGISTFHEVLNSLAAMPTAVGDKLAENHIKGVSMEFNEDNFKVLLANRDTLKMRLENKEHEMSQAVVEVKQTMIARVKEAFATGIVDEAVIVKMMEVEDDEAASAIALASVPSEALKQNEEVESFEENVEALSDEEETVLKFLGVK